MKTRIDCANLVLVLNRALLALDEARDLLPGCDLEDEILAVAGTLGNLLDKMNEGGFDDYGRNQH